MLFIKSGFLCKKNKSYLSIFFILKKVLKKETHKYMIKEIFLRGFNEKNNFI